MRPEACATLATIRVVEGALVAAPDRAVLVRSSPGGGASLVASELARSAGPVVAAIDALDERELLGLRRAARSGPLVLATERSHADPAVRALLDYLRPTVVEVEPLALDDVRAVLEAAGTTEDAHGSVVDDTHAAAVRRWTDGRAGDAVDVARHLAATAARTPVGVLPGGALVGFAPSATRWADRGDPDRWAPWAIVAAAHLEGLPVDPPAPTDGLRPIDAAVLVATLADQHRLDAIAAVLDAAAAVPAATLGPEAVLQLATWWCVADRAALDAGELGHLVAALQVAFERNRLQVARPIAERLWRRTRFPLAGVALASALARSGPDRANRALLDDLAASGSDLVADAVTATRATWTFHHEHRAEAAEALLRARLAGDGVAREASRGTLATLELNLGRPDAVEALLAPVDRAGGGTEADGRGPTPFGVNALVLADLARSRHRSAIERLDRELEQRLDPGPHLSVDRDRFYRTLAAVVAGWADPVTAADLDRTYQGALDGGDDWTIGWIGWGAGVHAARIGRFTRAHRRLRTSAEAFVRAHRPGFAMWPAAAAAEIEALAEVGDPAAPTPIPVDHAVVADRARAELALALAARRADRPGTEVAARLDQAARTAAAAGEVLTAHLVALEQLLAGLDPSPPPVDPLADGAVVEAWAALDASRSPGSVDDAGRSLVDRGWVVLGVRLRAHAARGLGADDPRAAGRVLQEVRTATETFDAPLRPWVLAGRPDLPTLSAREREVAEAVAGGASRDEVAATLVLSRRTIDSHLQRIYAKLGVSSRGELRAWLDRVEP
jgi:DNA-binding CsgD family transcriptional regulator